jgi:hypothetical protein
MPDDPIAGDNTGEPRGLIANNVIIDDPVGHVCVGGMNNVTITGNTVWNTWIDTTTTTTTANNNLWGTWTSGTGGNWALRSDDPWAYADEQIMTEAQRAEYEERQRVLREQEAERRRRADEEYEARQRRYRERYVREQEQLRVGDERAQHLLRVLLNDEQWASWEANEHFMFTTPSGVECQIRRGYSHNITVFEDGEPSKTLCAHPSTVVHDDSGEIVGQLPQTDVVIAQILALRSNEERFMDIANVHWLDDWDRQVFREQLAA